MICQAVLGNLDDADHRTHADGIEHDQIELTWTECRRRFLRKRTRNGRNIGTLLPVGTVLHHSDVLHADASLILSVSVQPCAVLLIRPLTIASAAQAAYLLGEIHAPLEIAAGELFTPEDDRVAALLRRFGLPFELATRRFTPSSALQPIAHSSLADLKKLGADANGRSATTENMGRAIG
jgi:urease accessory protein